MTQPANARAKKTPQQKVASDNAPQQKVASKQSVPKTVPQTVPKTVPNTVPNKLAKEGTEKAAKKGPKQQPKQGIALFAELLELRSPPLIPELRLFLATEHEKWRDPEALAASMKVAMPYWAVAWAGGIALARYVLDHPQLFAKKRVVDFASGSGLVALALAKVGAKQVTAVDIDPLAGEAIAANARANALHVDIEIEDWLSYDTRVADIVLAGDACYDRVEAVPILRWLRLQAAFGADVLLGDSHRPWTPKSKVALVAELSHLVDRQVDDDTLQRARVIRLT